MIAENTKLENRKPKDRIVWLLFALIIVAVYFFALGSFPLVGPDEARYAQVAREMFERGDWITPTLGGFDWFEKPALLYWLQIVSYKIFGVGEFAARFGSALFGLGTIFCLWILGRNVEAKNAGNPYETQQNHYQLSIINYQLSNWLALIAASSVGLLVFSRGASFDIILTFPITAALVGFYIYDQSKKKSFAAEFLPLIVFYFFIGVALLAKGLIGIVFPFAIVAFYYLLSWKIPPKIFITSLFWGTLLSFLIAAIWYLPMYQMNGWKFVDEFFIQHHFQRFTSDKYQHHQPFWFFFLVLPLMTIPWLPFFLAAIYRAVRQQISVFRNKISVRRSPLAVFALAWLLVPLVFFSISGSKLPGYILPALPAALILTARCAADFAHKSAKRRIILQSLALATFIIVFALLQFVVPNYAARDSVKFLIEAANDQGYADRKIVNLYTVSHNAEFYAPGRLIRETNGKLKRYDDFSVLVKDLKSEGGGEILVLVSHENIGEITQSEIAEAEVLSDNGETAIVLTRPKN